MGEEQSEDTPVSTAEQLAYLQVHFAPPTTNRDRMLPNPQQESYHEAVDVG